MTAHYAKLTDQTVRRRWQQAARVNISGERVTIDPDGPLGQAVGVQAHVQSQVRANVQRFWRVGW